MDVLGYKFILDKMRKRLEGWRAKHLSMEERATLIQSMLNSIPIYLMQVFYFLISICNEIEKIRRKFL